MSIFDAPGSLPTVVIKRSDDEMIGGKAAAAGFYFVPRYCRRLEDKILIALHHACDQDDNEVAEELLHVLESIVSRQPGSTNKTRRHTATSLVTANQRIGMLRVRPPVAPPSDASAPGRLVEVYAAKEDPALVGASSSPTRRGHPSLSRDVPISPG